MERKKKRKQTPATKSTKSPMKWNYRRIKQAYNLALLGLTDPDIANEMDISLGTLEYWKRTKEEFYDALKEGKTSADGKVVNALYQNAVGYTRKKAVVHNNKIREFNEFGAIIKEYYKIDTTYVEETVAPDVKAQIKWLQARQPDKWADTRSVKVKNQLNISIQNNSIDFSEVSDKELAMIKKLGLMTTIPIEEGDYDEG